MRIVKLKTPEVLGVPAITLLLAFRVMPKGNAPEETLQLYGVVPPDAKREWV